MNKPEFTEPDSARPELLCFLVAIAAASYALTQEWRVDHVVECCRQWLKKNGLKMHWLDRILIGQLALKIASQDLLEAGVAVRLSGTERRKHYGAKDDGALSRGALRVVGRPRDSDAE
jgi:hypothetical protein